MKPKHKFLLSLLTLSLAVGSLGACGKRGEGRQRKKSPYPKGLQDQKKSHEE